MNLKLRKTDRLLPCPFCGGTDLELENTHTPAYWISCKCGAEVHGILLASRTTHRRGVVAAIERWNRMAS